MDCGRSKVLIKRCACMNAWIMGRAVYHEQLFEFLKGQIDAELREGVIFLSLGICGIRAETPVRSISRSESLFASSSLLSKEHS